VTQSTTARIGIDVGGTFTDILYEDFATSEVKIAKVLTSSVNQTGLGQALDLSGIDLSRCADLVYSTTLATNAILEGKLGRCVLVTTKGFRDVIELGRRDRAETYGLAGSFEPIIPRHLRLEVRERVSSNGTVLTPVDVDEVRELGHRIAELGVSAVVVCLLNSYANPENERAVSRGLAGVLPGVSLLLSAELHPEWGEFNRGTLAALHGSLRGLVGDHLAARQAEIKARGFSGQLLAMQSNGGVSPFDYAKEHPANLLLSGPAAGVIGASAIARGRSGWTVTCDMGGTSFDVGLLQDGRPAMTSRSEIAFRVPLSLPSVDVHELAAGGGSIAHVVAGRLLTVGPDSAGSNPGPACYGLGGEQPTVTDAAVVLNRFVEGQGFGSVSEIHPDHTLAARAIEKHVARPLGFSIIEAAEAIIATAAVVMAGGVRSMSVGRGLDPRTTTLMAAGGAGPQFACQFAREAGIRQVLIPRYPGVINALGCAVTDLRQDYTRTLNATLNDVGLKAIQEALEDQRRAASEFVQSVEMGTTQPVFSVEFEMQYAGQTHTVLVSLGRENLSVDALGRGFAREYAKWRGMPMEDVPMNVRSAKTVVMVPRALGAEAAGPPTVPLGGRPATATGQQIVKSRDGEIKAAVYERHLLKPGHTVEGPALVGQLDCSTWLPVGTAAVVATDGSLVVELGG
jgi:N-methylhydantoinase A